MQSSSFLEQAILSCLKNHWGITISDLSPLELGADLEAAVYRAKTLTQATYFVKLKPGKSQNMGARVVEALSQAGLSHLIPVVKTQKGELTQLVGDYTVTVFPFIKAQNGFNRQLSQEQWYSLGKALRQIHETQLTASLLCQLQQISHTPQWRQAVRDILPLLDMEIPGDEISISLRMFMKKQVGVIQRLVTQAEALAEEARVQKASYVLCHGDIHAGNILIDEKDDFYIVDWDAPLLAPKERDLMFIGAGVGNIWNKPEEAALFYQGYGTVDVNKALLAYYRHERILEDIAVYAQSLLLKTEGGPQRTQWYQDFCAQFEPQGVVDIAFKTYESLMA